MKPRPLELVLSPVDNQRLANLCGALDENLRQIESALDARKPLWIDTRNPFCLDLFERIARDVEWVVITEPLPDIDDSWILIQGERHVSEFQIEMMVSAVDRV